MLKAYRPQAFVQRLPSPYFTFFVFLKVFLPLPIVSDTSGPLCEASVSRSVPAMFQTNESSTMLLDTKTSVASVQLCQKMHSEIEYDNSKSNHRRQSFRD